MKIITNFIFFLLCFCAAAQNFNPKIVTLSENPNPENFSFLKEELKGVQVVMLGEKSHFDGNVFEMKTKIVKYLHQEMGFNTIAFESGVYDVWKAQEDINNGKSTKEALGKSLFQIWSKTKEFQSFIDFYEVNKSSLKLFGFDNQITGKYGEEKLIKDLYEYCNKNQIEITLNQEDLELQMESIYYGVFDEKDIGYSEFKNALSKTLEMVSKKQKNEEQFYWMQIIENLLSMGESSYKKLSILSTFNTTAEDNIRDKQMANNLLAYIKNHPNEKIICWGANQHFANDMSSINAPIIQEFVPMGSYVKKALKEKMYSLAAVTACDSIYINGKWEKTIVAQNSFEYYLKNKKSTHLFISSNQDEMKQKQSTRFFSPETFIDLRLDLVHDGYLFFDNTSPSTFIESENVLTSKTDENIVNEENKFDIDNFKKANRTGDKKPILLKEVKIVNNKKENIKIIKKVIDNIKTNYPAFAFNSKMYSNILVNVEGEVKLNLDLIFKQYDFGYSQNSNRNTKLLEEIKWNTKNGFEPTNIRNFRNLTYNNPIMYSRFLETRKFKKFGFTQNENEVYENKLVYVIEFNIDRDHYNYTNRSLRTNYSGTVYVNKEDFAIVKIIENWETKENQEEINQEFELYGWDKKYIKKELLKESITTYYSKINDLYYLIKTEIIQSGKIADNENNLKPFEIELNSFWSGFNSLNPTSIQFKEEQNTFQSKSYNNQFWDAYSMPK
nr:erythromycin esterase family protein [uncultured Flavobacterium sp.]